MKTCKDFIKDTHGASADSWYVVILFFMMAVFILIFGVVWVAFSNVDVIWSQAQHGATIKANGQAFVDTWDSFLLMAYIGLHLVIIASAFLLRTHPVLFLLGMFFSLILLMISPILSNQYAILVKDAVFASVAGNYPATGFIMAHLPFLELVWVVLILVLTYGWASGGDGL